MTPADTDISPLPTEALEYDLPQHLIATEPAEPRDAARMMVVSRSDPQLLEHRQVRDLPRFLQRGDGLVFNTTRVLPARLVGRRADTGGRLEGLFLDEPAPGVWRMLVRSNGRLRPGLEICWVSTDESHTVRMVLQQQVDGPWEARLIDDDDDGEDASTSAALSRVGRTPLPPYILRARKQQSRAVDDPADPQWYQTVFADSQQAGSVAAPTAGLHFTPELLHAIGEKGVKRVDVTLHVGPGTFKPVTAATLAEHPMHTERYSVPADSVRTLRDIQRSDGRLIAVGTTSVRTLESLPPLDQAGADDGRPISGSTDLLIAPGYTFRHVEGMLTNFHLPRSTLLALVAAAVGLERLHELYAAAVRSEYRFYSYGDAMLILP